VTAPGANARGIASILLAMALFVSNDSLVKLAAETLPVSQIMAIRGAMAVVLMSIYVALTVPAAKWRMILAPRVLLRGLLEASVAVAFLIALPHLSLADITAIQQATPLILTILSATLLAEHVGWRRWAAVLTGFAGVLLVIQPTGQGINIYALSALLCAALVAVRDIVTRGIDPAIPTQLVTFTTTVIVMATGVAGAPLQTWATPAPATLLLLAASAALVTGANYFIIRAFRGTEVSVLAPFRYSGVLWALALGYLIWGHIPNNLALAGTAVVVASGLYIMHREALTRRATKGA
jgi:drug/metabolite transporter (DMT)-like permease